MKIKNRILLSAIVAFLQVNQRTYAVQYTNAFLDIGIGSRAIAMGAAFTSLADDGSSFYWNPAGLAYLKQMTLSGMYGPQFGSFGDPLGQFHTAGMAIPLRDGATIGINWVHLSIDDIPIYPELMGNSYQDRLLDRLLRPNGETEGYFKNQNDAIYFSFAKMNRFIVDLGWDFYRVRMELPIGVNIKWIKRQSGDAQANGLGIDAGFQFRVHLGDLFQSIALGQLSLGMNFQDISKTTMNWSGAGSVSKSYSEQMGRSLRWGIGYTHHVLKERHLIRFAWEQNSRWIHTHHFGIEYFGFSRLALRFGVNEGCPTGGAGLRLMPFSFDYAFLTHELDHLHRLSLSIEF